MNVPLFHWHYNHTIPAGLVQFFSVIDMILKKTKIGQLANQVVFKGQVILKFFLVSSISSKNKQKHVA